MPKIFETLKYSGLAESILPVDRFQLFSDIGGLHIQPCWHDDLIKRAEKYEAMEYDILPAGIYMQFKRNGNRSVYQDLYYKRRKIVLYLALAESIEKKGRFIDKIVDGIWLLLEESTWVVPAHNPSLPDMDCPLPYAYKEEVDFIDLFSAETGALLAFVYHMLGDRLDAITPLICDRILYELNRRITLPFLNNDKQWWMGFSGRRINNWCPWIASNVLTVCALCEKSIKTRKNVLQKTFVILDHFTSGYHDDGGCDEGPGYWNEAGACYFDCLELIYDMTGGAADVLDHPFIRNMGEYIAKVNIYGDHYINFADCAAKNHFNYLSIARFGRRAHSDMLENFGKSHIKLTDPRETLYNIAREIKNLCEPIPNGSDYRYPEHVWLDGICIMAARENSRPDKGLFFAIKGGCNAESHNHNDVGNFIVYSEGKPLIIDVGVGTYTADTFNENRYKIWTMQSSFHNLPKIGIYEQMAGEEFFADEVDCESNAGRISMSLKEAYPKTAGIIAYRRTGELSGGAVKITDFIHLEQPADIVFHIMTADRPMLSAQGSIALSYGRTLRYDDSLKAAIDEIELTDPHISDGWNRSTLYRIRLEANAVTQKTFEMSIQ